MKKISEKKKMLVVSLLKTGATGYEIAEQAGVSVSTVNKIRKELEMTGFDIWHVGGVHSKWMSFPSR